MSSEATNGRNRLGAISGSASSTATGNVLVIGEPNVDIIVCCSDVTPRFGEAEQLVDDVRVTIGSSSAIFACGIARLGLPSAVVGVVGKDALGRFLLNGLKERGVDITACLPDGDTRTGATVVLSAGARDRAILTWLGTIGTTRIRHVPSQMVRAARHVHVGAFFLQRSARRELPLLFDAAQEQGSTTSLDGNFDPNDRWDGELKAALTVTDVFFANANETRSISGEEDLAVAAAQLATDPPPKRRERPRTIVVKKGAAGALAYRSGTILTFSPYPATVRETTGAGDSMAAGFVYGLLAQSSLQGALALGVTCGTLSTRLPGGVEGQPTLAEVLDAIEAKDPSLAAEVRTELAIATSRLVGGDQNRSKANDRIDDARS
jgi:sugar/nucleoside kinase (ribokinase family)